MPIIGFFDPQIRPDVNLIVDDEDRYKLIPLSNLPHWEGTEEQRHALLSS